MLVTIAGAPVGISRGSLSIEDRVEERTIANLIAQTNLGTRFQKGQPVKIIDNPHWMDGAWNLREPGDATLGVGWAHGGAGGAFDAIGEGPPHDVLKDGSFEAANLAAVQTSWTLGDPTEFVVDTVSPQDGLQSVKCTTTRAGGWNALTPKTGLTLGGVPDLFAVTPGQQWRFSLWSKQSVGVKQSHAKITYFDSAGVYAGTTYFVYGGTDGLQPWTNYTGTTTIPVGAAYAQLALMAGWWASLVTPNQASLETGTTGWTANGNCAIAQSAAQALDGTKSLSKTSTAAGDMKATTNQGAGGMPVSASTQYTAVASFRSAVSGRSARVRVYWYQSGGGASAVRAFDDGSNVTDTTSGWTQASVTAVSPSDAAFAAIETWVIATGAASEVHYVDAIGFVPGSSTVWPGVNGQTWFDDVRLLPVGSAALVLTNPDATHYGGVWSKAAFRVSPGQTVNFSARMRGDIVHVAGVGPFRFRLTFANVPSAAAQPSAAIPGASVIDTTFDVTTTTTTYTGNVVVPLGYTYCFVELYANGGAVPNRVYVDDVTVGTVVFAGAVETSEESILGAIGQQPLTLPQLIIPALPLTYWRLSELVGTTAYDSIGSHRDGTITGAGVTKGVAGALVASGDTDPAMDFNGSTGWINMGTGFPSPTGPFTIEAMVKPTGPMPGALPASHIYGYIGRPNSFTLLLYNTYTNGPSVDFYSGSTRYVTDATSTWLAGVWHHVCGVYDGSALRLYVDGVQVAFTTPGSRVLDANAGASFGINLIASDYFTGSIDEVAVYNRGLSPAEVAAHSQAAFALHVDNPGVKLAHRISCTDNHYLADKRTIAATYVGQTAAFIINDIITGNSGAWLAAEGISAGTIQTGPTITGITFDYRPATECIDKVAELAGFTWWIDTERKLQFVSRSTNLAPWDLTTAEIERNTSRLASESPQYRNRQFVKGFQDITASQTESSYGDSATRAFVVSFPVAKVPTVEVSLNGAAFTTKTVGIKGVDTGKDWYWSKGDAVIMQDLAGTILLAVDRIRVTYQGLFSAVVTSSDTAAVLALQTLEGVGSGYVDGVEDMPQATDKNVAFQTASQLLQEFAVRGQKLTFSTRRGGLRPGQLLSVKVPEHGLNNAQLLVCTVGTRDIGAKDAGKIALMYTVEAVIGPVNGSWTRLFDTLVNRPGTVVDTGQSNSQQVLIILAPSVRAETWGWTETFPNPTVYTCSTPGTDSTRYPGNIGNPC